MVAIKEGGGETVSGEKKVLSLSEIDQLIRLRVSREVGALRSEHLKRAQKAHALKLSEETLMEKFAAAAAAMMLWGCRFARGAPG